MPILVQTTSSQQGGNSLWTGLGLAAVVVATVTTVCLNEANKPPVIRLAEAIEDIVHPREVTYEFPDARYRKETLRTSLPPLLIQLHEAVRTRADAEAELATRAALQKDLPDTWHAIEGELPTAVLDTPAGLEGLRRPRSALPSAPPKP